MFPKPTRGIYKFLCEYCVDYRGKIVSHYYGRLVFCSIPKTSASPTVRARYVPTGRTTHEWDTQSARTTRSLSCLCDTPFPGGGIRLPAFQSSKRVLASCRISDFASLSRVHKDLPSATAASFTFSGTNVRRRSSSGSLLRETGSGNVDVKLHRFRSSLILRGDSNRPTSNEA